MNLTKTNYALVGWMLFLLFSGCQATKDHPGLAALARADQADRVARRPETSANDIGRKKEVYQILAKEELSTSNDYFNAAIVLQHGEEPEDYQQANALAKKAVELNPENTEAKVLIAQSQDRYLVHTNQPQWYGTQRIELGEMEYLYPVDTTAITEQQRAALGVRTLKEWLPYFNEMHGKNAASINAYFLTDSLYSAFYPEKRADLIGTLEQLYAQIEYPEEALKNNVTGKVLIEYTIDTDGNVKDAIVAKGLGFGCDEEALRVIRLAKYKNYMKQDIERRTPVPFEIK